MELGEAFRLLESRLPGGDKEARVAFEKVQRKITKAAGSEDLAALDNRVKDLGATVLGNFEQVGKVFKLLATSLETDTPESKAALVQFLRKGE